MPLIPNFPKALLDEHRIWHHTNHLTPGSMPPPGFGEKFLRFHRDYINRVLHWYDVWVTTGDGLPVGTRFRRHFAAQAAMMPLQNSDFSLIRARSEH
ncbi:hypothetical protein [Paenibacillus prosopidis]|uniref:Uncharacterized protein n=1 Tax=Paenibacillus prosopidis TaxID=630520 RepID=A0A368VZI9_9BACL|nr:hypothetical protein [Paenibacillus prosopidis]RCW47841.1 hypothetical protein DFP97_10740 [Paenibacillus prosopidis]